MYYIQKHVVRVGDCFFFASDAMPRILGFHEIFHIFVMLGSAAHFRVVRRYITVFDQDGPGSP